MLTQTLQGALQAQIRSATGKTNQDFNGDLHDLCDIYALPAAPISGRIIGLAKKFDTSINSSSAAMNYLLANSSLVVGPAGLFATGAQGAWYDPSDSTTLFSDTAGTTPSPAPGGGALSVVGLMLDKSQGGGQVNQLVTGDSSNFSGGTVGSWTSSVSFPSTTAVVSGAMRVSSSVVFGRQVLPVSLVAGRVYVIQATINAVVGSGVGGTATANFGISTSSNGSSATIFGSTTSGTPTVVQNRYTPSTTGTYYLICGDDGNATTGTTVYDNIYVNQLPLGNHAISYNTTTARPELSARVNLLTYSEQFDNAAWTKTGSTVSANSAAAPDGTTTADTLTQDTSTGVHDVAINPSLSGGVYSGSVYVKPNGTTRVALLLDNAGGLYTAYFDITAGTSGSVTGTPNTGTASISSVGNGWFRIVITGQTLIAPRCFVRLCQGSTNTLSFTGDGTSGIFIWGADLRPANIGTSVPAYQRIADQYTYDSSGFPRYLVFNGTASGMYTPANLNLSGTDKATVFAGVRKLSDAAGGVVAELSASVVNPGTFLITASPSATARYQTSFSDSASLCTYQPQTFTAPISNVVDASFDLSAGSISTAMVPRVNTVVRQDNASGTKTGSGNFVSSPLNIGARNAQSGTPTAGTFLNGYIYSLIVVGAASTAAQISSTESWINVKEGGVY